MVNKTKIKESAEVTRNDSGYMNALLPSGVGNRMGNYSSDMMAVTGIINYLLLQNMYLCNGFARTIVDIPAEEMTRAGFEIDSDEDDGGISDDDIKAIKSKLEELDWAKYSTDALKWRGAFGGGFIVMGIKDGGKLQDELNEPNVQDIEFLRVYSNAEVTVNTRYDDINNPKFGKPELYLVSGKDGGISYLVHETRALIFDGESVPNDVRVANNGWGASTIQKCYKQLIRLEECQRLSPLLLERMQQAVHGIPNLSEQVDTPEGEAAVVRRIQVVDTVRGVRNTVVIDALETYEIKSMSLSGVKDILDKALNALSAVSGVPTSLLGEFVGGLSNGDSNKEGWYANIEGWQIERLKKPLDRIISIIHLAATGGKTDGGIYTIKFCPLFKLSDKDQAEIEYKKEQAAKSKADTLNVYMTANVMDQNEARDFIAEDYDLKGTAPELPETPAAPMVLNPGQKVVAPIPGNHNLAPPAKKP